MHHGRHQPDGIACGVRVCHAHNRQLGAAECFVQRPVGGAHELAEVRPQQELPKPRKIRMLGIFQLDDPPWILSRAHAVAAHADHLAASHDGKGEVFLIFEPCLGGGWAEHIDLARTENTPYLLKEIAQENG